MFSVRTIAFECWSHCMVLRRWTLVLKTNPNSFQGNLGKPRNPLPLTSLPQAGKQVANLLIIHIWLALIPSNIVSERGLVGCRQTSHWLFFPFDKLPGLERFPFWFSELTPLFQLRVVFLLAWLWHPDQETWRVVKMAITFPSCVVGLLQLVVGPRWPVRLAGLALGSQ